MQRMETTRRSFLKLLVVAGATAASPGLLKLVSSEDEKLVLGMVRELFHFDIIYSRLIVRHDIRTASIQLGVDGMLPSTDAQHFRLEDLEAQRQVALDLLQAEIDKHGIKVSDLRPLELPPGYEFNKIGIFTPTWTGFSG